MSDRSPATRPRARLGTRARLFCLSLHSVSTRCMGVVPWGSDTTTRGYAPLRLHVSAQILYVVVGMAEELRAELRSHGRSRRERARVGWNCGCLVPWYGEVGTSDIHQGWKTPCAGWRRT